MKIDWLLVIVSAIIVIGLVQRLKTFLKKIDSKIWEAASFALCFLVSAAIQYLPLWIAMGLLVAAVTQLGYENIIQLVKRLIDNIKEVKHD